MFRKSEGKKKVPNLVTKEHTQLQLAHLYGRTLEMQNK